MDGNRAGRVVDTEVPVEPLDAQGVTTPAIAPVNGNAGLRDAQAALLATRPPVQPLAHREASGLPNRNRVMAAAASAAIAAESVVLTPTSTTFPGLAPANRRLPLPFKPIHPDQVRKQEKRTNTALCPGIAMGIPAAVYFPARGPRIHAMERQ